MCTNKLINKKIKWCARMYAGLKDYVDEAINYCYQAEIYSPMAKFNPGSFIFPMMFGKISII